MPAPLAMIERGLGWLARAFAVIGGIGLVVLMGITVVSVFWRYILNDPIFGIEDLSTMTLTIVVASGVAYGAVHGAHISVNVLSMVAGRHLRRISDIVVRGLGAFITGYAAWGLVDKGGCGLPCGAITSNLGIAHPPFYMVLAVAMGSYSLLLVTQLAIGLAHWRGTDPNEAVD